MTRTRDEFIALHQYELMGLLLDAVTVRRSGGELAGWLEGAAAKLKARLGRAYDDLVKAAPVNGVAKPQPVRSSA